MRLALAVGVVVAAAACTQTPFEFDVVRQLIEGEPHVSVLRIEILPDTPVEGETTLSLSARAGLYVYGSDNRIYPDSQNARDVVFSGALRYRAAAPRDRLSRILRVVSSNLQRYPGVDADHLDLDFVSADDMSWLRVRLPMDLVESYIREGTPELELWKSAEIWGAEVGTCTFPLTVEPPLPAGGSRAETDTVTVLRYPAASRHAWKSVLLPGWGQLASGRGIGWINIAVEIGGAALLANADYREAGAAVLATNHLISIMDLL
jgi:hypothetical protein